MRIIFLDIDGVLNKAGSPFISYDEIFGTPSKDKKNSDVPIDLDCLNRLKQIIEAYDDVKIVWSTSWKKYNIEYHRVWRNPLKYLETIPWIKDRIIGKTPTYIHRKHYEEIKFWFADNPGHTKYVILEDSYFPNDWFGLQDHLVHTESTVGLTDDDVKKAIKILA